MTTSLRLIAMLCLVQLLVARSPASAQHSSQRGLEYLASGEYRSALSVFDSLLAEQPQNHRLHYLSGLCKYLMADYQGSATAMEMALRGDSLSAQYYLGLGKAYAALNLLPAARVAFESAVRFDTSASTARQELVRVLCMMKRFDDAEQLVKPSATFDELLIMAKGLLGAGKHPEALEYVRRAVSMDSTNISARILLADIYFAAQRYDDAFALYASLMMENQNSAHVARKLAFCYQTQGSRGVPVAILMMQKYMRLSGDTTAADLARIGSWFYALQRFDSSAVYYALAKTRDSTSTEVRFNYGLTLFRLGKLREAERELRTAEQLSASTRVFQASIAKTIASVVLQRKATGTAIQYYRKALGIDPTNEEALYGLAASYDMAGNAAQAVRWYRKFLDTSTVGTDQQETIARVKARIRELQKKK